MNVKKVKKQIEKEINYYDKMRAKYEKQSWEDGYYAGYGDGLNIVLGFLNMRNKQFDEYCKDYNIAIKQSD